jgi:hypothetical protein
MLKTTVASDFASRLYDKLAASYAGENLFLSPFSIRVALAMSAVGARGDTRQELVDLIGAPDSVEEQNQQFARLLQSVYDDGKRPFELAPTPFGVKRAFDSIQVSRKLSPISMTGPCTKLISMPNRRRQ